MDQAASSGQTILGRVRERCAYSDTHCHHRTRPQNWQAYRRNHAHPWQVCTHHG